MTILDNQSSLDSLVISNPSSISDPCTTSHYIANLLHSTKYGFSRKLIADPNCLLESVECRGAFKCGIPVSKSQSGSRKLTRISWSATSKLAVHGPVRVNWLAMLSWKIIWPIGWRYARGEYGSGRYQKHHFWTHYILFDAQHFPNLIQSTTFQNGNFLPHYWDKGFMPRWAGYTYIIIGRTAVLAPFISSFF